MTIRAPIAEAQAGEGGMIETMMIAKRAEVVVASGRFRVRIETSMGALPVPKAANAVAGAERIGEMKAGGAIIRTLPGDTIPANHGSVRRKDDLVEVNTPGASSRTLGAMMTRTDIAREAEEMGVTTTLSILQGGTTPVNHGSALKKDGLVGVSIPGVNFRRADEGVMMTMTTEEAAHRMEAGTHHVIARTTRR